MIIGVGTDLMRVDRIERVIARKGERFAARILRPEELVVYRDSNRAISYLAKRFAAKEAASKALGTGIGKVSWQDFLVANNDKGAPILTFFGAAQTLFHSLKGSKALLSLSDEKDYVLAFVVLSTA